MNLYMCRYMFEEWICYVFAETRDKAKGLFHDRQFGEFVDIRATYIGKSEIVKEPSVVDDENHKNYPAVLALCKGFDNEGYQ